MVKGENRGHEDTHIAKQKKCSFTVETLVKYWKVSTWVKMNRFTFWNADADKNVEDSLNGIKMEDNRWDRSQLQEIGAL